MEKFDLYLVRHGETAWTLTDQHTGLTDLPLTAHGVEQAKGLQKRLQPYSFDHVFTSPLQRAKETCKLAGYLDRATIDPDLVEWNYGKYEGLTTAEILAANPSWDIFRDGVPEGETLSAIGARADRVLARVLALEGTTVLFSSGHFLRILAARYLGLPPSEGRLLLLNPASLSILGYEHIHPVIAAWNLTLNSTGR